MAYIYIDNLCGTAVNRKANLLHEEFRDGKWNVTGRWGTREDCFDFGDDPPLALRLFERIGRLLLVKVLKLAKKPVYRDVGIDGPSWEYS